MRSSMTMALAGLVVAGAIAGDRLAAAKCKAEQRFQKLFEIVGQ